VTENSVILGMRKQELRADESVRITTIGTTATSVTATRTRTITATLLILNQKRKSTENY